MLSTIHKLALQEFLNALEAFASNLSENTASGLNTCDLNERARGLQKQFQAQLLPLSASELPTELAGAWQALQIELHRNLRLLRTEVVRLQAARQPSTQQQRLQAVRDRLQSAISQVRSLLEA